MPDGATTAKILVVFGDLRGWNRQHILQCITDNPNRILHADADFATVSVATETVRGPVVHDDIEGATRTIAVYAGNRIPAWVTQRELTTFGWVPGDELPLVNALEEVNVLLLDIDDRGQVSGFTRHCFLEHVPRPLERITIALADGHGPSVPVRVLETGAELTFDGATIPFSVMSSTSDDLPPATLLQTHGWCVEPCAAAKTDTFKALLALSEKIESHAAVVLGRALTTSVTVHEPDGIADSPALPLLPNDVRNALLRYALDNKHPDTNNQTPNPPTP